MNSLVVPVNNILTTDRVTGLDDYSDLDSIIQELEVRIAQMNPDKHADPNMYGPTRYWNTTQQPGNGDTGAAVNTSPLARANSRRAMLPGTANWRRRLSRLTCSWSSFTS